MAGLPKRYSAKLKFQVVLEALSGRKTPGQIAKMYGVHPNSVGLWKKVLLEHGSEVFERESRSDTREKRIADLEQLLGKKKWRSRC